MVLFLADPLDPGTGPDSGRSGQHEDGERRERDDGA